MATAAQPEILDLRHFSAATLRPLLAEESRVWSERLRWDYRSSANLLLDYLDSHVLPGYVAVEKDKLCGYIFCVYESSKAVIGDVYCAPSLCEDALRVEARLIDHLLELLQFSPGIDRIETQLLLHPHGAHARAFESAGFEVHPRLFMELDFELEDHHELDHFAAKELPAELVMRPWQDADFAAAGRLIAAAYQGHLDSRINDQYQTVAGSLRFLHNIVRFPGCGIFDAEASCVLAYRDPRKNENEIAGMLLCSLVGDGTGHVTQICVAPAYRRRGLGTLLLQACTRLLVATKYKALTLTVTEENTPAVELYRSLGFRVRHTFDAMVWKRPARER
jgi:ribosomal protein S18 acetylase RimI-like enzyme